MVQPFSFATVTAMSDLKIEFHVESVIARQITLGKSDFDLGTAVLNEIRSREQAGQVPLWPHVDYYLHESAVESTCKPDGRPGTQNDFNRYLISAFEREIRQRLAASITSSSSDSPSYTDRDARSKGDEGGFVPEPEEIPNYRYWPEVKTTTSDGVVVDWGVLFKISCKIANDLCRNPDTPVHYHNDFHELVQEAWFAIQSKAIPGYGGGVQRAEFTTFAYRVIKNHLCDFARGRVDPVTDRDKVRTRSGRDLGVLDLDFDSLPWGQPGVTKSPHRHAGERSAVHP
jgi:hypothetical protein